MGRICSVADPDLFGRIQIRTVVSHNSSVFKKILTMKILSEESKDSHPAFFSTAIFAL